MLELLGTLVHIDSNKPGAVESDAGFIAPGKPGNWQCEAFDTGNNISGYADEQSIFSVKIMFALAITWFVTYFCVFKGVKSSSYVVWITVPGPILFIFIMVINGLCLPNADEGIRMYLRGEVDGKVPLLSEKLADGQMWADAAGQIFFSLGVCMGVMTSYASYNRRNKPIIRDVFFISFGNCLLSFYAGFAVFSIVGYLRWLGSPVAQKTSSSGLAFVAYPAAAETMPYSNFWTMILGLTLFLLGIDTAFSLVEAISTVVYDVAWGKKVPRKLTALIICVVGWCFSLLFASSWGYTYFDVVDRYISVYLMFVLGIMQCFGAGWMFRYNKLTTEGTNKTSIMLLTLIYWGSLIVCGPVTVFLLGSKSITGIPMYWGIFAFWGMTIFGVILSYVMRNKETTDLKTWYEQVFLYGAHELALEVCDRHDELRVPGKSSNPWWKQPFIFWWGFSIKYFIPWALYQLMMWNFKADLTFDTTTGRSYGNYHVFWQCMGFVFPAIGLVLFIVPIFWFWGEKQEDTNFNGEEHEAHQKQEKAFIAGLKIEQGEKDEKEEKSTAGAHQVVPEVNEKVLGAGNELP